DVLWLLLGRLWTRHWDAGDGVTHQLHVMTIRSRHRQADGHALAFGQQTAFYPGFAAVGGAPGGTPTDFFPRPAVLCSSHRPDLPIPSRFLSTRRTVPVPLATASGTHRRPPIPESGRGRLTRGRCRFRPTPSTDSPCARHKISRQHRCDLACVVDRRQSG